MKTLFEQFEQFRKLRYINNKIIIVDIQPSYRIHMNMDMHDFTEWLNYHDYLDILYLYNGPDLGYEDEGEIREWLYAYGLDSDRNITFYEKNYGFFRDMMDSGASKKEIVTLGKYMIENNISDSRDITIDKVPGVNKKWLKDDYSIYIPDVKDVIDDFLDKGDVPLVIGGGKHECFGEIILLLKMMDIKYDKESQFIY